MCIWDTGPDYEFDRVGIKSAHLGCALSFGGSQPPQSRRARKTKLEVVTEALEQQRKINQSMRFTVESCSDCKRLKENHAFAESALKSRVRCAENRASVLEASVAEHTKRLEELLEDLEDERKRRRAEERKREALDRKVDGLVKKLAAVRDEAEKQLDAVQVQLDALREAYALLKKDFDEIVAEAEMEVESNESTGVTRDHESLFERLRQEVGLTDTLTLPPRKFTGDRSAPTAYANWRTRTTRHLAAVMKDRELQCVIDALKTCGHYDKIVALPEVRRVLAQEAVKNIHAHWGARLAVHLWDRLDLSRSEYDTLRHLLSYVYDPKANSYNKIVVWQNPEDPSDFVAMAALAGRNLREAEYQRIVDGADIVVSQKGSCSRSASKAASELYSNYELALRKCYTVKRPAMPVLVVDGTGQSLNKALTHCELGSADFTGDCKQSRKTLQPLAAYADNDHTMPLREHLAMVARTYNELIKDAVIAKLDGTTIPARPICSADMQGVNRVLCGSSWDVESWSYT